MKWKSNAEILYEYDIKTLQDAVNCAELWNVNNGRTLCIGCHQKTENYGKGFCKQRLDTIKTNEWRKVFAWYPVLTFNGNWNGTWIWLEFVWIRWKGYGRNDPSGEWQYSPTPPRD